jgi:hypothetical protein
MTGTLFVFGCGKKAGPITDGADIASRVSSAADAASSQSFTNSFVPEAFPTDEDRARFASFSFAPIGKPKIEGDTATIKVRVSKESAEVGQVEWTFVRQENLWKIKSAPLP